MYCCHPHGLIRYDSYNNCYYSCRPHRTDWPTYTMPSTGLSAVHGLHTPVHGIVCMTPPQNVRNEFVFHWQWNESNFYLSFSLLMSNDLYPLGIAVGERYRNRE